MQNIELKKINANRKEKKKMSVSFPCDKCSCVYAQKGSLRKHQQTKHSAPATMPTNNQLPHSQIEELKKEQFDELRSELFAHILDLKQQMSLLAKKTTKWCVVCFERENTFALEPCRHKCVCKQCAQTVLNRFHKCPICQTPSTSAKAIYDISAWDVESAQ